MNRKILIILVIVVFLMGAQQAPANSSIFGKFKSNYEVSSGKLNACATCMASTSTPVSWNKYGTSLRSDPAFNRNDPIRAMKNIESLDSDGDGFTNIEEITGSTFPGDESDFPETSTPAITQTAMQTATVTQTAMQTATPEETQPTTDTNMNAFITIGIFMTIYFSVIRKRRE